MESLPLVLALMTAQDLLSVKWVSQVAVSPAGPHVAYVLKTSDHDGNRWHTNLYLVRADEPAAAPRPLTNTPGSNGSPAFSPDGRRVAFVSTRGGDTPQIWIIPVDGGEAVQLTRLSTGAAGPLWSPDGKHLAFASPVFPGCKDDACNALRLKARRESKVKARVFDHLLIRHWNRWRDERRSHLFVVPADGGEPRDLTPGPHDVPPVALAGSPGYAFSPDGKTLAYAKNTDPVVATSTNNDLFEVPLEGGEEKRLTTNPGNDHSPRYSPDGRYLAYLSMERAGYEADRQRVMVRDRQSGAETEWTQGFAGQPHNLLWAADSKTLYFTAPQRGFEEIFAASTNGVRQVSEKRTAKHLQVLPDGRRLVFTHEAADRAPEVHLLDLETKETRPLTRLNEALSTPLGLRPAEHHWFEGAAGAKIHAVLVKPPGFREGARYPAVVLVHGGPQGMTGDDFHPRWNLQMFASAGYVVFGINFHGSTGFGQAFTDAIQADWGGKPYEDVMRGTEYLAALPFVDPKRICAAGASYGGYLANWMATQTQRFACLVSHSGIFNLESKYASTEELWFPEWELRGTPWTNRRMYRRWSPHSHAEKIRTPTLVVHGQRDFRVPVEQGLQMFTALQRQGVASRLLYFPDEDHFVQKPQNIVLWWNTIRDWLGRHLREGP
jgi:dipeptidyl aminopeptidase/acylaminoacyl peptidase